MSWKSNWEKIVDWVFGYDLFISYSRIDWNERYAVTMGTKLGRPPFELKCFVDAKSLESDRSWKIQGSRALKKSSKILLLLTPGILRSPGVREELELNKGLGRNRRPITLINIQQAWEKHISGDTEFVALLSSDGTVAADVIRIDEKNSSAPTPQVLRRIQNDFTIRSENAKRTYILSIVALFLFFLSAAAILLAGLAREQRNTAIEREKQAQTNHSLLLAAFSDEQRARSHASTSLFLALKGLPVRTWDPERPLVNESMNSLLLAGIVFPRPQTILQYPSEGAGDGGVQRARFGFEQRQIVTEAWYGRIRFWDAVTGALIADTEKQYRQHAATALSPDAPLLAIAMDAAPAPQVHIWDIGQGKIVHRLATTGKARRIAFGGSGRIATEGDDGTVQVWDTATGREATRLERTLNDNLAVAFASDKRLVTFSRQGVAQTWNTDDGKVLASFDTKREFVDRAELSPDAALIVLFRAKDAASYKIDKVRENDGAPWREEKSCSPCISEVWNLRDNKLMGTVSEHRNPVFPLVTMSPTLDTVGVSDPLGAKSADALLWNVASGKVVTLQGHQSNVTAIAFSPDGRFAATSSWDRTARLWSVATGSEIVALRGHTDHVYGVAFDGSGTHLLTGSRDKTARKWALGDPARIADLPHPSSPLFAVAFSPDGRFLAAAGGQLRKTTGGSILFRLPARKRECDGKCFVRVWSSSNWQTVYDLTTDDGPQDLLVFRPDSKLLVAAPQPTSQYASSSTNAGTDCYACAASAWNVETGRMQYRVSVPEGVISDVKFSLDNRLLAISTDAGSVHVFDADTGKPIAKLSGSASSDAKKNPIKTIAFDPSGQRLLGASWDGNIYLWDVTTQQTMRTFKGHTDKAGYVRFDATGARLLSSSQDMAARLWDTASGAPVGVLSGHTKEVNQALVTPDGKFLATASGDNSIGLWRADDTSHGYFLRGHSDSGAFSGVTQIQALQGNRLLSFGTDGAARIWDLSKAIALDVLTPPDGVARAIAINPSESQLAVARRDGRVEIRRVEVTRALQQIDAYASTLYPVLDGDVTGLPGLDASIVEDRDLERLADAIGLRTKAFEAIAVVRGSLPIGELQEFAESGVAAAHRMLAAHYEAKPQDKDARALAFFHHRIAERLFRMLKQGEDANFEAARRVSLASLLNRDQLSRYWRQAQSWLPHRTSAVPEEVPTFPL